MRQIAFFFYWEVLCSMEWHNRICVTMEIKVLTGRYLTVFLFDNSKKTLFCCDFVLFSTQNLTLTHAQFSWTTFFFKSTYDGQIEKCSLVTNCLVTSIHHLGQGWAFFFFARRATLDLDLDELACQVVREIIPCMRIRG